MPLGRLELSERAQRSALFVVGLAVLYGAVLAHTNLLDFQLRKDEQQFWRQTQAFAEMWPLSASELRGYDEPMTPLAFVIWGFLEHHFEAGVWLGRSVNFVVSIAILAIVGLYDWRRRESFLAAVGLVVYPYFIPLGVHLYTDMLAAFFVLMAFRLGNQPILRVLFFVLAISTRQYMVVFPAALVAWQGVRALQRREFPAAALPDAIAGASLLAWIAFFGGLGPTDGLNAWPRHSNSLGVVDPMLGGYFLTTLGLYFVIPEMFLYQRWEVARDLWTRKGAILAALLLVLFVFDPPIFEDLKQGLFGRFGDLFPTPIRLLLFYSMAWIACVRFARIDLGFWLVFMQLLVTLNTWSAWEKYVLSLLVVLWFLRGSGQLDGEFFPRPRPT